VDILKAN